MQHGLLFIVIMVGHNRRSMDKLKVPCLKFIFGGIKGGNIYVQL